MDWNIQVDVASACAVFEHGHPTLVPLSVTVETALRRAYLEPLRRSGPLAQLIARQAAAFAEDEGYEEQYGRTCDGLPDDTINFQHDGLACAVALGWREGVTIATFPLHTEIVDGWVRQRVAPGGKPTQIVTRADGAAFNALWLRVITGAA